MPVVIFMCLYLLSIISLDNTGYKMARDGKWAVCDRLACGPALLC
jgi:hypothetical protein